MANEIITMLQGSLAAIKTGVDDDTRAVAGGGAGSNKRISIDGGVFRKFVNGREVAAVEDRHMLVIFVKMSHNPSRTYYSQAYKKGMKVSPTCWSSDSKTPDASVKSPVATACDKCPMSVKGSGNGGTGTACRLSWRTAVVLPGDPAGDVMQLVLPATSCFGSEDGGKWPFRPYIQMLANNNISAGRVVTKVQFDTKASVPRLLFSPISAVDADELDTIVAQGKSDAAERAVKLTVFQQDGGEETVEVAAPVDGITTIPMVISEELFNKIAEKLPEPTVAEPVLRQTTEPVAANADAAAVINRWKSKK